jgi:GNAT superfamily N-acetyltransferase
MDADIQIRAVGPPHRDLLTRMYDRFDPLGAALGLPPRTAEARRDWIVTALGHLINVAALLPARGVMGHCFLAADKAGSAEMAVFVLQEYRRRGVGTALVKAALQWGGATGLRRVWSVTSSANRAALHLQRRCGFRMAKSVSIEAELEVDLPAPWAACEMPQRFWDLPFGGHGEDVPNAGFGRNQSGTLLHTRGSRQDGVGNQPG